MTGLELSLGTGEVVDSSRVGYVRPGSSEHWRVKVAGVK